MPATAADRPRLRLLIPELLGPLPAAPMRPFATPTLDLLLARADAVAGTKPPGHPGNGSAASDRPSTGLTGTLLRAFGATASAPYALAMDDPDWDRAGHWMHADPVHLRPDRDQLRLFDASAFNLEPDEATALVAELNAHFAADGLHFIAPTARRWYLRAEPPPALRTTPLDEVSGRSIDGLLPTGDAARRWAQLMNEAQMLLFQSPVNQARERRGQVPVNGLWTWGGGVWPAGPMGLAPTAPIARVIADTPLAKALAQAASVTWQGWSDGDDSPAAHPDSGTTPVGTTLAVVTAPAEALRAGDLEGWAAALVALDQWLTPWCKALGRGALDEIELDPCDGSRWRCRRGGLRRFWRRPRPLVSRVCPADKA